MPLSWKRGDEFGILTVIGEGDISRQDIENYLQATVQEDTKAHAKMVDITGGNLAFDRDDLESVARMLLEYGSGGGAGPVAMVVQGALNIDMAVLLKQRVGQRPFRIFTDPLEARSWLLMPVRPVALTPQRAARVSYQVASAAR